MLFLYCYACLRLEQAVLGSATRVRNAAGNFEWKMMPRCGCCAPVQELLDSSLRSVLSAAAEPAEGPVLGGWYGKGEQVLLGIAMGLHYLHSR